MRGPNLANFGLRFPSLSDAYDLELRRRAHQAWKQIDRCSKSRRLHEGIYAFVGGPRYLLLDSLMQVRGSADLHSYETRAECRMLRNLGADLVGMSTVPEIVVARHCNIRLIALSLVTNNAVQEPSIRGDDPHIKAAGSEELAQVLALGKANHEEVLKAGEEAAKDLQVNHRTQRSVAC